MGVDCTVKNGVIGCKICVKKKIAKKGLSYMGVPPPYFALCADPLTVLKKI